MMFSLCMHISNPVKPCGQRCWHLKPKHSNPSPPLPSSLLLSNPSSTTVVKYAADFCYTKTLNNHEKNKVLWQHIRKHLEGAILIPADDKRLNGVTRKTSSRSSWLMVMDVCMCGCQHVAYLIFVLTVLTRFMEKRVKKFDGWSYNTPICHLV